MTRIKFNHTWRECNYYADWIVNYSLNLNNYKLIILPSISMNEVRTFLIKDKFEIIFPNLVKISYLLVGFLFGPLYPLLLKKKYKTMNEVSKEIFQI